jgi:hypothetical protein
VTTDHSATSQTATAAEFWAVSQDHSASAPRLALGRTADPTRAPRVTPSKNRCTWTVRTLKGYHGQVAVQVVQCAP